MIIFILKNTQLACQRKTLKCIIVWAAWQNLKNRWMKIRMELCYSRKHRKKLGHLTEHFGSNCKLLNHTKNCKKPLPKTLKRWNKCNFITNISIRRRKTRITMNMGESEFSRSITPTLKNKRDDRIKVRKKFTLCH